LEKAERKLDTPGLLITSTPLPTRRFKCRANLPGAGLEPAREFNFPTDFRTTTAFAATCLAHFCGLDFLFTLSY